MNSAPRNRWLRCAIRLEDRSGPKIALLEGAAHVRLPIRTHLLSDEAVFKLLYLGLRNISQRWAMSIQNWGSAINQFAIIFDGQVALCGQEDSLVLLADQEPILHRRIGNPISENVKPGLLKLRIS